MLFYSVDQCQVSSGKSSFCKLLEIESSRGLVNSTFRISCMPGVTKMRN